MLRKGNTESSHFAFSSRQLKYNYLQMKIQCECKFALLFFEQNGNNDLTNSFAGGGGGGGGEGGSGFLVAPPTPTGFSTSDIK